MKAKIVITPKKAVVDPQRKTVQSALEHLGYKGKDAVHALQDVLDQMVRLIWHKEASLGKVDAVVIPGGFSYGDYLRTGAIARFSPIMEAVQQFAAEGGLVFGICNGFQILCETGLL